MDETSKSLKWYELLFIPVEPQGSRKNAQATVFHGKPPLIISALLLYKTFSPIFFPIFFLTYNPLHILHRSPHLHANMYPAMTQPLATRSPNDQSPGQPHTNATSGCGGLAKLTRQRARNLQKDIENEWAKQDYTAAVLAAKYGKKISWMQTRLQ